MKWNLNLTVWLQSRAVSRCTICLTSNPSPWTQVSSQHEIHPTWSRGAWRMDPSLTHALSSFTPRHTRPCSHAYLESCNTSAIQGHTCRVHTHCHTSTHSYEQGFIVHLLCARHRTVKKQSSSPASMCNLPGAQACTDMHVWCLNQTKTCPVRGCLLRVRCRAGLSRVPGSL